MESLELIIIIEGFIVYNTESKYPTISKRQWLVISRQSPDFKGIDYVTYPFIGYAKSDGTALISKPMPDTIGALAE